MYEEEDVLNIILYLLVILYTYHLVIMSECIEKIYKNLIFRILVLGLIIYLSSNNLLLAIIIALLYIATATRLLKINTKETFNKLNELILYENFRSNI